LPVGLDRLDDPDRGLRLRDVIEGDRGAGCAERAGARLTDRVRHTRG
jgi:hypothetical protein